MGYNLKTIPACRDNYGGVRDTDAIRFLVYHYTANDGDTAEANGNYFASHTVQASAHYFVDDDTVVCSVPESMTAWSVGGEKWADCPQTGGGTLFGRCTNYNSISVEMCDTVRDGRFDFTEKTLENAAALGREIMARYGLDADHVVRHFDVNGKHCPGLAGWWGRDGGEWKKFKERLEENMTGAEIYMKLREYLITEGCPGWAKAEYAKAVEMGITDGSAPMLPVPRYQAALMAKKAVEIALKAEEEKA